MNEEFILKIVVDDGEFVVKLPDTEKRVKSLGQAFDVAKEKTKAYSKETEIAAKKNIDLTSNAGLAGATLTELGRTISDLPFGIRGVANNLSQLSTLFITLVAKSSDGGKSLRGVGEAFKLLKNQLLGPLGIILVFQSVIALLDFFSQKSKKAADAADLFTDATDRQAKTLSVLESQLKDTNLSLENRQALLDAASVASNRLSKILDDETLSIEERNKKRQRFLELEIERLKRQSLIEKAEEDLAVAVEASTKAIENENKGLEDFVFIANRATNSADIQAAQTKFLNDKKRESEEATDAVAGAEKALTSLLIANSKIIAEQSDLLETNTKKKKDNTKETKAQIITFKEFLSLQEQGTSIELANIDLVREREISALKQRGLSFKDFQKAKDIIIGMSKIAELQVLQDLIFANKVSGVERIKIEERIAQITGELLDKTQDKIKKTSDESKTKFQKDLEEISFLLGEIENIANMFTDAELSREERKTVMLNNQLRERLRNENLSKEERIRINKEIEENELKLQKKRDEIAERNFKLQKAFAIAQATINTALAISDVLAREKTGLIGKTAAAIIIGALGAAQIAAIASTKFVPTATSVPGGVGSVSAGRSGGGTQDPAFNIVGTGQQFQLAQVIAQRTGEPIRAFVVSGDVRTGLALDRNIINSSKIN
tara:strand:+ start:2104 stop:4095 length:1992 start_codon:yes stop_codon:yes gene_type:complete